MNTIFLFAILFLSSTMGLAAPVSDYYSLSHPTHEIADGSSGRVSDSSHHHKYTDPEGALHHVKHSMDSSGQVTMEHSINGQPMHAPQSAPQHLDAYLDHDYTVHETQHSIQNQQLHSHHTQTKLDGSKNHKHFIDGHLQEEHDTAANELAKHSKYHAGGKVAHEELIGTKVGKDGHVHTFHHKTSDGGSTRKTDHVIDGAHHKTTITTDLGGPTEFTTVQHAGGALRPGHASEHFSPS